VKETLKRTYIHHALARGRINNNIHFFEQAIEGRRKARAYVDTCGEGGESR
jgi:hypothetical protein